MLALVMKDQLVAEMIDEDFDRALESLNGAGRKGLNFIMMDGADGNRTLVNVENINTMKELDND